MAHPRAAATRAERLAVITDLMLGFAEGATRKAPEATFGHAGVTISYAWHEDHTAFYVEAQRPEEETGGVVITIAQSVISERAGWRIVHSAGFQLEARRAHIQHP